MEKLDHMDSYVLFRHCTAYLCYSRVLNLITCFSTVVVLGMVFVKDSVLKYETSNKGYCCFKDFFCKITVATYVEAVKHRVM